MMTYNISMDNKNKTSTTRENKKYQKVCFIGHRRIFDRSVREKLKTAIENEIKNGCKFFTMGTHGEFDEMALSVCRELRNVYKDIEIEVVITSYHKVENRLLDTFKNEYNEIEMIHENYIPYSDIKTTMYEIEDVHFKKQITESNHQMIDNCDTLICYVNKKHNPSGAKHAMNYAKRKGLKIINLYDEKDEPTYGMTKEERQEYYKKLWEVIKKWPSTQLSHFLLF